MSSSSPRRSRRPRELVALEVRPEVHVEIRAEVRELDHRVVVDGDALFAQAQLVEVLLLAMRPDALGIERHGDCRVVSGGIRRDAS